MAHPSPLHQGSSRRSSIGYPDNIRGSLFTCWPPSSGITYRALEERKVDLVIARIFKPIAHEQMDAEVLYNEQEVVVAGAHNPWTRRHKVELAELMREPWTLPPPDTLSGSVIAQAFRDQGLDLPPTTIITATVPVRSALLATGRFLTIILRPTVPTCKGCWTIFDCCAPRQADHQR